MNLYIDDDSVDGVLVQIVAGGRARCRHPDTTSAKAVRRTRNICWKPSSGPASC